ncbi:unnamed protein product [Phytophthora fragariaefolia]|uniref:Unnamed protein product n=1 Tax=Phytophthora fragariaefolia TaxID=1490495 RepID=A0A9W6WXP1_9STRA|nr:unnamed protein product [Phytophthora fragariaefolia]
MLKTPVDLKRSVCSGSANYYLLGDIGVLSTNQHTLTTPFWRNHYDPNAPWDYTKTVTIESLQDVFGEPPDRCYLVEWAVSPLQLSWVWEEELRDFPLLTAHSDHWNDHQWDEKGRIISWKQFSMEHYARDNASDAGFCFMDSIRTMCYNLGRPHMVTLPMWYDFEAQHPQVEYVVKRSDVTKFFRLLQQRGVPLDYSRLMKNEISGSLGNVAHLEEFVRNLPEGMYLASVGDYTVGHFVIIASGLNMAPRVLDGYEDGETPPYNIDLLSNYLWIDQVKWLSFVDLDPTFQYHGKQNPKIQTKRAEQEKSKLPKAVGDLVGMILDLSYHCVWSNPIWPELGGVGQARMLRVHVLRAQVNPVADFKDLFNTVFVVDFSHPFLSMS